VLHGNGGIAGGTLGYGWQSGAFVFGIEGDASWANIDPRGRDAVVFPDCTAGGLGVCGAKLESLETIRARLGYSAGNVLVYATGGGAFGEIKSSIVQPLTSGAGSKHSSGWTVGGGVEAMLGQNWSAKIEYLHINLGDNNFPYAVAAGIGQSLGWKADIVRLGLNYKFGAPLR
jgi:outer membrane immunogenic protein